MLIIILTKTYWLQWCYRKLSQAPDIVKVINASKMLMLTLSPPIPLRLYILPHWYNPPLLIFDTLALRTEHQNVLMSKNKNGGLDQYGAEPFEQQQFGTAGVEGVKTAIQTAQ